jgi:hypothetical protein
VTISTRLGRLVFGAISGVALAVLSVAAGHASSLSIGQNYQESSNKTSSAPPVAGACNALTYCYIEFTPVPAGKQLVVTQVSCALSVSAGNVTEMYLAPRRPNGTAVERFQILESTKLPSNQPGSNVNVNNSAMQLFDQKDRPESIWG